jgi:uncharacterized protein
MKIAVVGGGASGIVTAYLLDRQGHEVTVFERQAILGGHIRTLNQNVKPNQSESSELLECGVLEFPTAFHSFMSLMEDLGVELEPIDIGSGMFFNDGSHFLSAVMIKKNFTGLQRWIEYLRIDSLYLRSSVLWLRTKFSDLKDFYSHPLSYYLKQDCTRNTWLKLLVMYSYSMPLEQIDDFPSELAVPVLRDDVAVDWVRIKGGVYSYIEKILSRFRGEIVLNSDIEQIFRDPDTVKVIRTTGEIQEFDKVVFATPPDQVMELLADPRDTETQRFSGWKANHAKTVVHHDRSMYDRYGIQNPSEFDFFQTPSRWGYNSFLNHLCGIISAQQHFLAFQLDELIAPDRIIHIQEHHTPLYTTESFQYRDEVVATNGEYNTYHAGAYLGDGLHEGAISSAFRVAKLIG